MGIANGMRILFGMPHKGTEPVAAGVPFLKDDIAPNMGGGVWREVLYLGDHLFRIIGNTAFLHGVNTDC